MSVLSDLKWSWHVDERSKHTKETIAFKIKHERVVLQWLQHHGPKHDDGIFEPKVEYVCIT